MRAINKLTIAVLSVLLFASTSAAFIGDMGTIESCYPGLLDQVLLGVKPFALQCETPVTVGACYHKGKPWANLLVAYVPKYAIEVTGHAGTTIFTSIPTAAQPDSMVTGQAANDSNTRYKEAHIWALSYADIMEIVGGSALHPVCLARQGLPVGLPVFVSEVVPAWRAGVDPTGVTSMVALVGAWGHAYPRQGWADHPSNVTSSLLTAYRAQSLASDSFLVDSPTVALDKYEIGGPNPGACYPIGAPTTTMEALANRTGCADRIITIYWELETMCCDFGL